MPDPVIERHLRRTVSTQGRPTRRRREPWDAGLPSFVVRRWWEGRAEAGRQTWRVKFIHVVGGDQRYVEDLAGTAAVGEELGRVEVGE